MVEKYIEVVEYCMTKLDPYNLNYNRLNNWKKYVFMIVYREKAWMFHGYREYCIYDWEFLVWREIDLFEIHHQLRSLEIFEILD